MALVLVVDDEQRARDLIRHVIAAAGHEVIEADSAEAALTAMAQRPADVVFTDVQMPGNDGVWLTLELRKHYPNTAVVLATGVGDLAPTITLRFGVISYWIKPFALDSVRPALAHAVDWHDAAAAQGTEAVEQGRLEEWLNSLQID